MQDPSKFITRLQLALRTSVTSTTKCFASTNDPLCLEILCNNGLCPHCWSPDLDSVVLVAMDSVLLGYNALPHGSRITMIRDTVVSSLHVKISNIHLPPETVAYPGILFEAGVQQIQLRIEDRERGSGGGSPLVRGSGGSCNLVQEISFHIVKVS